MRYLLPDPATDIHRWLDHGPTSVDAGATANPRLPTSHQNQSHAQRPEISGAGQGPKLVSSLLLPSQPSDLDPDDNLLAS
jgi:hypothetical protein